MRLKGKSMFGSSKTTFYGYFSGSRWDRNIDRKTVFERILTNKLIVYVKVNRCIG